MSEHTKSKPASAPRDAGETRSVTLRDGRAVNLRAVSPADEGELLQAFERLSEDARYMRFMHAVRNPDIERVRSALATFPSGGIGLVATVPADDGIDIVGSAIAVFASDRASCEFAITVASAYGGAGLATALMNELIDEARRRKMREMEGFVLSQNQPMLRLARRLGFSVDFEPGDPSVRICRLALVKP
ncbi:GNAT family N-acetyltransferase [Variovorax sp. J22R133]|uniref:GNAT family N-acetyltransferase n=1 Tax=Variovorax brevis TaxID=3053503 RepID=UPI002574D6CF|nr:GNAT family N-acetyltransferase [Variovorax sp. J22R133]MDM0117176.1 GNAT family N-acetyltransferase [Variovorax sp. J22R133]